MDLLPEDIFRYIFLFMSDWDLGSIRCTCSWLSWLASVKYKYISLKDTIKNNKVSLLDHHTAQLSTIYLGYKKEIIDKPARYMGRYGHMFWLIYYLYKKSGSTCYKSWLTSWPKYIHIFAGPFALYIKSALIGICESGNYSNFIYIRDLDLVSKDRTCISVAACKGGNVGILCKLLASNEKNKRTYDLYGMVFTAARYKNYSILAYLRQMYGDISNISALFLGACASNDLDNLRYILDIYKPRYCNHINETNLLDIVLDKVWYNPAILSEIFNRCICTNLLNYLSM